MSDPRQSTYKVGDRVIVKARRGSDRDAEITEVVNPTVFRVRYLGKDADRVGVFPVGITNIQAKVVSR